MIKDPFMYLQYWGIMANIHRRYDKEFTKRQCKIVRSDFERGLKSYNKQELKDLSYDIHKTKAELNFALEELNKKYRDRLRKERGPLAYIFLSIMDNIASTIKNITEIIKK